MCTEINKIYLGTGLSEKLNSSSSQTTCKPAYLQSRLLKQESRNAKCRHQTSKSIFLNDKLL